MTKAQILNTLSAERKFAACVEWMHQQGSRISGRTLRRGLENTSPTPRQQKAIKLAEQYIGRLLGEVGPTAPIKETIARMGMIPEQV